MRRRVTKNTRGMNAEEKAFMGYVKGLMCCICHSPGPSIVDHMYGSTFKHNKVLIGMWALLSYCYSCDSVKTRGGRKAHDTEFGITQAELWEDVSALYEAETGAKIPDDVKSAIKDWGR